MEMIDTREGMIRSTKKEIRSWSKDTAPALAVLLVTVIFSFFQGGFELLTSWQAESGRGNSEFTQ
jgi:hypothetical protein